MPYYPAAGMTPAFGNQPIYSIQPYPQRSLRPVPQPWGNVGSPVSTGWPTGPVTQIPRGMEGVAQLTPQDQQAALQQRLCPVTGQLLGSSGRPVRVNVAGRTVFVCGDASARTLLQNPSRYLFSANVPAGSFLR